MNYDSVIASTSTGQRLLFRVPGNISLEVFTTYHGDRRIAVGSVDYSLSGGQWAPTSVSGGESLTGAALSTLGRSHDGDSSALAVQTNISVPTVQVRVGLTGQLGTSIATLNGYIGNYFGTGVNSSNPAAFTPQGSEVIVGIRGADLSNPVTFWAIRTDGTGSPRTLFTLANAGRYGMAVSEDGKEMTVGYYQFLSPTSSRCVVEFRATSNGTLLQTVAEQETGGNLCASWRGGFNRGPSTAPVLRR